MRLVVLLMLLIATAARADVPKHEGWSVKAAKRVAGKVVAAKLTLRLVTCNNGFIQSRASVGLVEPSKLKDVTREGARAGKGLKFLSHEETDIEVGKPREVELKFDYGDVFQSGEKLAIISVWPSTSGIHVFGAVTVHGEREDIELP